MWTLVGITQTVPSAIAHAGAAQIQPVRHPLMQGQNYEPMTLAQGDSTVFNWTGAQFGLAANTEASACFAGCSKSAQMRRQRCRHRL